MRSRNIALGCALAGALGLIALPLTTTHAASRPVTVSAATRAALTGRRCPGPHRWTPRSSRGRPRRRFPSSTSATTYVYASRVWLTVSLGSTRANRTVAIYAAPVGVREWLWHRGKVNSAGKLRAYFRLTRTTTFTVVFGGDARDAPARASRTVQALARVADGISGYYAKTRVGGTTYYVFHASKLLVLHAAVSPNKRGQCLKPETQQWDTGAGWDDDTAYGCDSLDSGSHDSAPFNLAQAIGDRYRIRADYVRGRAGPREPQRGRPVALPHGGEVRRRPGRRRRPGPAPGQPARGYPGIVTPEQLANLAHLRRARDLMDREYARPLDVAALARAALMSPAHFSRQFRAAYGETPYAYLMTRRIERAKALLRRGDLSVTEVCLAVGCTSLGSFSARFTQLTGETPTAYRARDHGELVSVPGCIAKELTRPSSTAEQDRRSACGAPAR